MRPPGEDYQAGQAPDFEEVPLDEVACASELPDELEGDPLALPSNQPEESPEAAAVQQDVGARHKFSKRLKQ